VKMRDPADVGVGPFVIQFRAGLCATNEIRHIENHLTSDSPMRKVVSLSL
jgi:hypothetical protein